eukprot:scaffold47601_cov51-Phaeocystis_antarctica.AAC.1
MACRRRESPTTRARCERVRSGYTTARDQWRRYLNTQRAHYEVRAFHRGKGWGLGSTLGQGTPLGLPSNVSGTPTLGLYQPRALCAVAPHLLPGLRGGEDVCGGNFGLPPGPRYEQRSTGGAPPVVYLCHA